MFWGHAINAVHLKGEADFPHLYGPFGVDIFFVISGFVMVYSSERLFGQPGAPITFFARRLARIVPLFWAATTILVWVVVPYASTKAVLGSLFFGPHIPSEAPLLLVGWTLIFEMFFYVVFAIEKRVPTHHPLRLIRRIVNEVLAGLRPHQAATVDRSGGRSSRPEDASLQNPIFRQKRTGVPCPILSIGFQI
jgi:peptidoglycan/LPS O-acetylase OafA/YrhL